MILCWLFRLRRFGVPGWSELLPEPGFATDGTVAMAAALALFLSDALPWAAVRDLPWESMFLLGGGVALICCALVLGMFICFKAKILCFEDKAPLTAPVVEMTDMTQIAMAHPIALSPQNSKMQQQWGSLRNLDLNNATVVEAVPQQQGAVASRASPAGGGATGRSSSSSSSLSSKSFPTSPPWSSSSSESLSPKMSLMSAIARPLRRFAKHRDEPLPQA